MGAQDRAFVSGSKEELLRSFIVKLQCEHCSLGLGDGLSLVYRVNLALMWVVKWLMECMCVHWSLFTYFYEPFK